MIGPHVENLLIMYLADELDNMHMQEVELHLQQCDSCREAFYWLMQVDAVWEDGPIADPGPAFTARVMSEVDRIPLDRFSITHASEAIRVPLWKRSDVRNMIASVAAAILLWQGLSDVVLASNDLDASIEGYTFIMSHTLNAWVSTLAHWLNG